MKTFLLTTRNVYWIDINEDKELIKVKYKYTDIHFVINHKNNLMIIIEKDIKRETVEKIKSEFYNIKIEINEKDEHLRKKSLKKMKKSMNYT